MRDCDRIHLDVTAWHEAGHLVAALFEGYTVYEVEASPVRPGNGVTRLMHRRRPTRFDPALGVGNGRLAWAESVARVQREMRVFLAGPLAEAKVLGKPLRALGARSDLDHCKAMAKRLLMLWGDFGVHQGATRPRPHALMNQERARMRRWIAQPRVWSLVTTYAEILSSECYLDQSDIQRILNNHDAAHGQRGLDLLPRGGWGNTTVKRLEAA
ncbi:hypothetical protein J2T60_001601 [Natronospira proteinivora]|uniref:Peptidase M41-like protein n=1 Tax=Natronospira proteinivora TaxID=1807133 RepID=A0ABT1G8F2_9GAMM|nr:hypothetical protein [Natronospira proteinivora]MCP1727601.1 hypothetical protein [Natronospira proteinivora]